MSISALEEPSNADAPPAAAPADSAEPKPKSFWQRLGPGLVTGASDDDPSGIATYSQAGAQYQYALLWMMPFTLPLMASIQEISARIGRVSGRGIAGNIRRHYSPWLLYPIVGLLVLANTINLGADIAAMGAAVKLVVGGPALLYALGFAVLCVLVQVFVNYRCFSQTMKWLTVVLFAYVATVFMVHVPWRRALYATLVPSIAWRGDYFATFIAVLGTTISPYLFFWQASQETEELRSEPADQPLRKEPSKRRARFHFVRIRWDTWLGMGFSNLVAFFIVLTAAVTLHGKFGDVQTSEQAAEALRPVAGRFAFWLFALGIVGTGLLAVPVLAGSAAYAVGEALKWPTGLDRKPLDAKGFYGVLAAATLLGLAVNFTKVDPIRALYWSAVINGVVAVPIMFVMMRMLSNPAVMGKYTRISRKLKVTGWLATLAMTAAAVALIVTWVAQPHS